MQRKGDPQHCLCLCLCQTNLHMRVALQAPPDKQEPQSHASDRRRQNAYFSAVHSEVRWGQQFNARALLQSLPRPPCSQLSANSQYAVLVTKGREPSSPPLPTTEEAQEPVVPQPLKLCDFATRILAVRPAARAGRHAFLPDCDFVPASHHGSICISGHRLGIGCNHCQRPPPHQQSVEPGSPYLAPAQSGLFADELPG